MKMITVTVTLHGDGGMHIVFADTADARYGTTVLNQLKHGKNIESVDNGGNNVTIPFESVVLAEVTESDAEYTKPEDAFCEEV